MSFLPDGFVLWTLKPVLKVQHITLCKNNFFWKIHKSVGSCTGLLHKERESNEFLTGMRKILTIKLR